MSQPFQFSLRTLLGQVALLAIGLVCLRSVGEHAGPLVSGCLIELSAVAFGAAVGILNGRALFFAGLFAICGVPFALKVMEVVAGINL
jgi:hypothetical protein